MFGQPKQDEILAEILPDGTVKITTDPISPANHVAAEQLLDEVTKLCGGPVERTRRPDAKHHHSHAHGRAHGH